ncbi:hypothetical protein [Actinoplanes sp. NPDC051411]|uniref:hypothetical protein n=1 Tax=Actinoplanes sp. NPDC051411 TaxID=3155522 RepID=UPI0034142690
MIDGAEHLRRFLRDRQHRNAAAKRPGLSPSDQAEARGLVNGLVAAGTVSEAVARSILDEVLAAARGPHGAEISKRTGHSLPVPRPPVLVQVIPVAAPAPDTRDVFALSADVWSASVSVRFGFPPNIDAARLFRHERRCTAIDDLGTTYKEFSRATTDAGGLVISTRFLRPAPSEQATTLTVRLDDNTTVVVHLQLLCLVTTDACRTSSTAGTPAPTAGRKPTRPSRSAICPAAGCCSPDQRVLTAGGAEGTNRVTRPLPRPCFVGVGFSGVLVIDNRRGLR